MVPNKTTTLTTIPKLCYGLKKTTHSSFTMDYDHKVTQE